MILIHLRIRNTKYIKKYMGYEIDFFPVGEGEKSGDAIALRFGNLTGSRSEQSVVVVDGGFKDSGQQLVEHIRKYYGTDQVDLALLTHPDADHASGLSVVLEELNVKLLAMHRPWEHASDIKDLFKDGRITASGLEERLERALQQASDLEGLAKRKGIPIVEPFMGSKGFSDAVHVLGPSVEFYQQLLANFRSTPEPKRAIGLLGRLQEAAGEVISRIQDAWHIDLLDDETDTTSAENNSSAIMLLTVEGHKILFTGDAGKTALRLAVEYADSQGVPLHDLNMLDVPHHGSKRNLSSGILKKINASSAFISASKDSSKHPAKKVTNALKKHGAKVYVTKGKTICHPHNAPVRSGWVAVPEEPFHNTVEE
jgi:beta-lactamase superfamily II metal-dependent hydrolase